MILGGAALTRSYVERDLREVYDGRLFYGQRRLRGPAHHGPPARRARRRGARRPRLGHRAVRVHRPGPGRRSPSAARPPTTTSTCPDRSPEVADVDVPTPPFWGSRVVKGIAIDEIAAYINETALFRNQWQFRPETKADGTKETDAEFKDRIRPQLRAQLAEAKADGLLQPAVVYGYFPANKDGDDLVIWTDESATEERVRFPFPRQREAPFLCIADFFRPIGEGVDVAAFHIVTMGPPSPSARPSCSPTTGTRSTCSSTASASRWPRPSPSCGTAASATSSASPTRTAPTCTACSASSTAAVATRGATRRARTSRTTRPSPRCSGPTASASRSARTPATSSSRSSPPPRSSATTPSAKYFVAR